MTAGEKAATALMLSGVLGLLSCVGYYAWESGPLVFLAALSVAALLLGAFILQDLK